MIPRTIHFCWFGRGKKGKLAKRCIASWHTFCPDYTFKEWNEDTFDITSAPLYVQQAYEQKKWAFVTDYVRYWVVEREGGIYLDTDVELLKPLDPLLADEAFFGFEVPERIASGLGFGATAHHPCLRDLIAGYETRTFIREDGTFDLSPCTARESLYFQQRGLVLDGSEQHLPEGIHVYPVEVLCPMNWATRELHVMPSTVSIHWYAASWYDPKTARRKRRKRVIRRFKTKIKHLLHLFFPHNERFKV